MFFGVYIWWQCLYNKAIPNNKTPTRWTRCKVWTLKSVYLFGILPVKVVYQMEKRKDRKLDRHVNSRNFVVRLDNDLYERFKKLADKQGKSRSSIIIELLDNYLSKNGDWKNPHSFQWWQCHHKTVRVLSNL